jgi:hypothetical protein
MKRYEDTIARLQRKEGIGLGVSVFMTLSLPLCLSVCQPVSLSVLILQAYVCRLRMFASSEIRVPRRPQPVEVSEEE